MKVHRALRLLDDPVAWVFESQQTAIDDADGVAGLTLPRVIVFEFQLSVPHTRILTASGVPAPQPMNGSTMCTPAFAKSAPFRVAIAKP